jgi:hypothetical protein
MKTLYAVIIGLTTLACASVQPARIAAGDLCLRCRRPIQNLRLAGEIVDSMNAPFPFRTTGCLAKYVKANSDTQFTAIFVTDFRTGKMIPATSAWFVPTDITAADGRSSEPDYYAFGSRSDAEGFKADAARFLRWSQVVAAVE